MPVTVKYEPAEATVNTATGPVVAYTEQEGLWAVRYLGRALSAPNLPDLQAEIDRLDRAEGYTPPAAPGPVPATLRMGRAGRDVFEDVTVSARATSEGQLEVIRANGRRDLVPEARVWNPLTRELQAELVRVHAEHVQARDHLDDVKEGAGRLWDAEGTIDVRYDPAGHHWTATAVHGDQRYGPFEERHATDAAYQARVALFAAQFPWTVEPAGTGVNPGVIVTPTEYLSTAQSYRTREDADRHVAAHRTYRAAVRAASEFHEEHRFDADMHFPPRDRA